MRMSKKQLYNIVSEIIKRNNPDTAISFLKKLFDEWEGDDKK